MLEHERITQYWIIDPVFFAMRVIDRFCSGLASALDWTVAWVGWVFGTLRGVVRLRWHD
jgi:hypothetical protein